MRALNEKGGGILDTLLVCILVGVLIGIFFPYYYKTVLEGKEVALRADLLTIRKGIQLYRILENKYPADLKSLIHQKYVVTRGDTFFTGEYLNAQRVNAEGNPIDPFGNPYRYKMQHGIVSSETKGYVTW